MSVQEDQKFWEDIAESIVKDVPRGYLKRLDLKYHFGVDPYSKEKPTLFETFLAAKKLHPTKLIIMQVRRRVGIARVALPWRASMC